MKPFAVSVLCLFLWFKGVAQDIPVDPYTGQPSINIPLCQVNDRSLTHGVALQYNASGVKISDKGGKVGQNWSLIAGGEVRRELRGLPDDYVSGSRSGWLHNANSFFVGTYQYPNDGSAASCGAEYSFINNFNHETDTEPDLFHFSAGDISGTFVFDNLGDVKLMPYQDVSVKVYRATATAPINKFEIITATGTRYTFDVLETVERKAEKATAEDPFYFRREYHQYKNMVAFTRAWKLREIMSAVGEKISFFYNLTAADEGSEATVLVKAADREAFLPRLEYTITETVRLQNLSSVNSRQTYIGFENVHAENTDHVQVRNITVRELNAVNISEVVKTIHLEYSGGSRAFLSRVIVSDACQQYNPYVFNYHSPEFPGVGTKHKDIWGYYLENPTDYRHPKIYVYPGQQGINRISLYRQPSLPGEIAIEGADMVSAGTSTAGVLSKITYPSGGTATLQYTPHEFYNPIIGETSTGGGLRVSSVTIHDGISFSNDIVRTFEYLKADGTTSGKLITLPSFWELSAAHKNPTDGVVTDYAGLSSLTTEEQWKRLLVISEENLNPDVDVAPNTVGYERVTERISSGKGKTVYQYSIPYVYGASAAPDWSPTYVHVAAASTCPSTAFINTGYYTSSVARQTPYDFARGVPTSVAHYAENDNAPLKETLHTYQHKVVSLGTAKGLRFEFIPYNATGYFFVYGDYLLLPANKLTVLTQTRQRTRDRDTPTKYIEAITDHTYSADHAFVASTRVTNSDGTIRTERFKYAKDYGTPGAATADQQVNIIDAMNAAGQTGTLVEKTVAVTIPGQQEKTIDGMISLFKDFGTPGNPVISSEEIHTLRTEGITGFSMSSFNGSGASRTFNKNGAYKKQVGLKFKALGDLVRREEQRQVSSLHPDNASGMPVASIVNAEPEEVIYSGFDHNTDYDFDPIGFTVADKTGAARTGDYGLAGWTNDGTKYLRARLKKKAGARYKLSAWYRSDGPSSGTHTLAVIIKNLSEAQIQSSTVTYTITPGEWKYEENLVDLSGIGDTEVIVEIKFTGSGSALTGLVIDDVLFAPEGVEVARNTYKFPYGLSSVTAPDGTIMKKEYDGRGKLKYVRDHDDNIVQRMSYTDFATVAGGNPISLLAPSTVNDLTPVQFTAITGCVDVGSIMWKVAPEDNPSAGDFVAGTATHPYTFPSPGIYIVTLRVLHSSYGMYDVSRPVTVVRTPLSVTVCVVAGATEIDRCYGTAYQYTSCEGELNPPVEVGTAVTEFYASASGCDQGATYTYSWETRPYWNSIGPWSPVGTNSPSISLTNTSAYEVRCVVTSSCGKTGEGSYTVTIYWSSPGCQTSDGDVPQN